MAAWSSMRAGLQGLFSSEIFMAHGHCYLWKPRLIAVELLSNGLIALAYLVAATGLTLGAWRGPKAGRQFGRGAALALALVFAAGAATHILDAWVIWWPAYWLDAAVRTLAALASAVAVAALLRAAVRGGSGPVT